MSIVSLLCWSFVSLEMAGDWWCWVSGCMVASTIICFGCCIGSSYVCPVWCCFYNCTMPVWSSLLVVFSATALLFHALLSKDRLYYNDKTFDKNLSFIHPKHFKTFEIFLQVLKHIFPIICCSETFFKQSSKDRYTPKGFEHVYDFRDKKLEVGDTHQNNRSICYHYWYYFH